jgi:uncharacterized membrane protein
MDRSRLEAFSDGVFAVAITLLALNLAVPGPGHGDLVSLLSGQRWAFLAYVVSFFTIGIVWVNHHVLIRSFSVVDRTLLFLNLVLLLFVVLIPFTTATVANYLPAEGKAQPSASLAMAIHNAEVAMVIYAAVLLGMSVGFGAIFEWSLHGGHRLQPLPPEAHWAARRRFVGGGVVYAIAMVVALFNAIASFVIIALVAVYYIVERTPSAPADPGDTGETGASG